MARPYTTIVMMMKHPSILLFLSIAACSFCLTACGDDDDSGCDPARFVSSCTDSTHATKCVDHQIVNVQCALGQTCSADYDCTVSGTQPSDPGSGSSGSGSGTSGSGTSGGSGTDTPGTCDPAQFAAGCTDSTHAQKCIDHQIVSVQCAGSQTCSADYDCTVAQPADLGACAGKPSYCDDEWTAMLCLNGTYAPAICYNGCVEGQCSSTPIPESTNGACLVNAKPACTGDSSIRLCTENYEMDDDFNPMSTKINAYCIGDTRCDDGACVPASPDKCSASACLDPHTLSVCENGISQQRHCASNEMCIADACRPLPGVTTCSGDADCAADQTCRDGLCYTKTNFDLMPGDPCDSLTFEEYCSGDVEVKCGYENTVTVSDCTAYNGCAVFVQKAYRSETAIRNAFCRGTDDELRNCTNPGVTRRYCVNIEDDYFPVHFSLADACVRGTDGSMIFVPSRDETNCGDSPCDDTTGLCPVD